MTTQTIEATDRLGQLRETVARLAKGRGNASTERTLLYCGAIGVPLGFLLIVLGYWGVAHSSREIEQIPYLVSGGLLGLALVFGGGFAYFAFWMTRLLQNQRDMTVRLDAQTEALVAALGRIDAGLASLAWVEADGGDDGYDGSDEYDEPDDEGGDFSAAVRNYGANGAVTEEVRLVATRTGSLAHLPDCPVVARRDDLRPVTLQDAGVRPCKMCTPG